MLLRWCVGLKLEQGQRLDDCEFRFCVQMVVGFFLWCGITAVINELSVSWDALAEVRLRARASKILKFDCVTHNVLEIRKSNFFFNLVKYLQAASYVNLLTVKSNLKTKHFTDVLYSSRR